MLFFWFTEGVLSFSDVCPCTLLYTHLHSHTILTVFQVNPSWPVAPLITRGVEVSFYMLSRALVGAWKCLNFPPSFSRPGKSLKTDMVLESPWICVWRSLKVLELDFLKCSDRTSDCYHQMHLLGSSVAGALPRTPLGELTAHSQTT